MRSMMYGAACTMALVMSAALAHAGTVVSPGKNAAYATYNGITLTNSFVDVAGVQLLKGAKKHVIEVDSTIVEYPTNVAIVLAQYVTINGITIEPGGATLAQLNDSCSLNYNFCTSQGKFWADIDTLEAAHPGMFAGQPLNIDVVALKISNPSGATTTVNLSIRARNIKK